MRRRRRNCKENMGSRSWGGPRGQHQGQLRHTGEGEVVLGRSHICRQSVSPPTYQFVRGANPQDREATVSTQQQLTALENNISTISASRSNPPTTLQWVLFAQRPLMVEEFADAMGFEDIDEVQKVDKAKDSVTFCGHLLSVSPPEELEGRRVSEGTVKIVHASVRDYLLSLHRSSIDADWPPSFNPARAHAIIASRCISYLSSRYLVGGLESPACQIPLLGGPPQRSLIFPVSPLVDYALRHWVFHLQKAEDFGSLALQENRDFFFLEPKLRGSFRFAASRVGIFSGLGQNVGHFLGREVFEITLRTSGDDSTLKQRFHHPKIDTTNFPFLLRN